MKRFVTVAACLLAWSAAVQAQTTIVVDTALDSVSRGVCSLRQAILAANTNASVGTCAAGTGNDTITFALGATKNPVINVTSALPAITAPVTIDGNTGGGRVALNGGGGGYPGLTVQANGTTIRSLDIHDFVVEGIYVQANNVSITNCVIGPNGGDGVGVFGPNVTGGLIGGTGPGQPNVIASNGVSGVYISGATGIQIRGNSIHDNGGLGIDLISGGNSSIAAPAVTHADLNLSGTSSCPACSVDLYTDSAGEGRTWLGSTSTNGSGAWSLNVPPPGPYVTATVTSASGNTSEFSDARPCLDFDGDHLCDGVEDSDLDGIVDALDNCILVPNGPALPDAGGHIQLDADSDGYGNACDADLNNSSGTVNFQDLALFRAAFGSVNADSDLNGSGGIVNFADLVIFRSLFGKPPGPSGLHRCGTPGTQGCGWNDGDVTTYGQSEWGSSVGTAQHVLINGYHNVYAYASGIFEVGLLSNFYMEFDSGAAVHAYLPQTEPIGVLDGILFDPTDSASGVFGGDVTALSLNIDFGDHGELSPANSGLKFGDLTVCGLTSATDLNGMSVRQVFGVENTALGGGSHTDSIADLDWVAFQLNATFDSGIPSTWAQDHLANGACP